MSDLLDIFFDDAARLAVVGLTPEQRKRLLHTLRSIQRDPELGRPYTVGDDVSGRVVTIPGDEAVPGMTLGYRVGEAEIRIVLMLAGP
ncbi:hypothetical protein [Kitasatospora sp. MAP5-34]|uniref:hypothetical protein n=1 Tax=Kitasatospora sp. MAP5-34 TaxID=3035102 RepID=UPI00247642BD|nr:hypothetical protein [Kitasatospora sp. MAP5-34]MDH6578007.1 hypothetical protein [Kitasatospora sp. MAP5-34]